MLELNPFQQLEFYQILLNQIQQEIISIDSILYLLSETRFLHFR